MVNHVRSLVNSLPWNLKIGEDSMGRRVHPYKRSLAYGSLKVRPVPWTERPDHRNTCDCLAYKRILMAPPCRLIQNERKKGWAVTWRECHRILDQALLTVITWALEERTRAQGLLTPGQGGDTRDQMAVSVLMDTRLSDHSFCLLHPWTNLSFWNRHRFHEKKGMSRVVKRINRKWNKEEKISKPFYRRFH